MDKILLMLQLQNQLNNATNGENWVDGITKNNKKINWKRCIYMETAEMVDSFAWKHWKNIDDETNWENLKIEIVDVWHFIMSLAIERYNQELKGIIEDLAIDISDKESFYLIDNNDEIYEKSDVILEKIEDIMRNVLSKESFDLDKLINDFFILAHISGLNLNSLYKLYVGKNILNQFRQDNGYKEGKYIKIWNNEEDNVIMQRLWQENENLKPDELYKELQKVYSQLQKPKEV